MASRGTSRKKVEPENIMTVSWRVETTISSRNAEEFEKKKAQLAQKLNAMFETVEEQETDTVPLTSDEEEEEEEDDTGEELNFDDD
jgi:predicted nucleic acid-binding protein